MLAQLLNWAVVLTMSAPSASNVQPEPTHDLLSVKHLSTEINLLRVLETPEILEVLLDGQSVKSGEVFTRPLAGFTIQVWLLHTDGTALAQIYKPTHTGMGWAGENTDMIAVAFDRVPKDQLAGVVVSVNGRLYARNISN
jgi:hypothetical protein